MTKRLNFGPYAKTGGLSFEEYVLNALNRIEKWSYDVNTRFDDAVVSVLGDSLLMEDGDYLLRESDGGTNNTLGLE
jgi:hypothetical protein